MLQPSVFIDSVCRMEGVQVVWDLFKLNQAKQRLQRALKQMKHRQHIQSKHLFGQQMQKVVDHFSFNRYTGICVCSFLVINCFKDQLDKNSLYDCVDEVV